MYQAVIFDFFGVFCSSMATDWFKKVVGSDAAKLAAFQALCTKSDYGNLSRSDFNTAAAKLSGVAVEKVISGIEAEVTINNGLVSYARQIKNREMRVACLSNGTREWTLKVIIDHGLADLFDIIVMSADLGIVKPSSEIYTYTLRQLGVPASNVIFVDDRKTNTDAAEALGIRSLVFSDTGSFIKEFEQLTDNKQGHGR